MTSLAVEKFSCKADRDYFLLFLETGIPLEYDRENSVVYVRWVMSYRLLRYFVHKSEDRRLHLSLINKLCNGTTIIPQKFRIRVRLSDFAADQIDYEWSYRMCAILYKTLETEKFLWLLSSYGGAFSAMGDYFVRFAEHAGRISIRQMQIASNLNDQVLLSRCKLFLALSCAQRGKLKRAARIVRTEYTRAKNLKNDMLIGCCQGTWVRIIERRNIWLQQRSLQLQQ